MRHVTLTVVLAFATGGSRLASATPFEPATVPDSVQAIGHVDVDALRKTQIFATVGGQAAIDAALDDAPPEMRPLARAVTQSLRGVSFWHGADHGALYLETRDGRALSQMLGKMPMKPTRSVDGSPVFSIAHGGSPHFAAVFGDTLVLADSDDSLDQSIHVLAGKAASLAGSNKLPVSSRQGVFLFVTLGDNMLGAIQKAAHSKVLQLGLRTLSIDVGEAGGTMNINARADMRTADALQKARSIVEGLRSLASLSDEPQVAALVNGLTITSSGLGLDISARVPVATLAMIIANHHPHGGHHGHMGTMHDKLMDKAKANAKDNAKAKDKDDDDNDD